MVLSAAGWLRGGEWGSEPPVLVPGSMPISLPLPLPLPLSGPMALPGPMPPSLIPAGAPFGGCYGVDSGAGNGFGNAFDNDFGNDFSNGFDNGGFGGGDNGGFGGGGNGGSWEEISYGPRTGRDKTSPEADSARKAEGQNKIDGAASRLRYGYAGFEDDGEEDEVKREETSRQPKLSAREGDRRVSLPSLRFRWTETVEQA